MLFAAYTRRAKFALLRSPPVMQPPCGAVGHALAVYAVRYRIGRGYGSAPHSPHTVNGRCLLGDDRKPAYARSASQLR